MAIVAVVVLSNPPPEQVPHVNALAGNTTGSVLVYHNGGDELKEEMTSILLNDNPAPVDHSKIFLKQEDGSIESRPWSETKTPWSVGKPSSSRQQQLRKTSPSFTGGPHHRISFSGPLLFLLHLIPRHRQLRLHRHRLPHQPRHRQLHLHRHRLPHRPAAQYPGRSITTSMAMASVMLESPGLRDGLSNAITNRMEIGF